MAFLLLQTGDALLLETGDHLLLNVLTVGNVTFRAITASGSGAATTESRVSQVAIEVISQPVNVEARISQVAIEVISASAEIVTTGTGGLTFTVPALSGEGNVTSPELNITQEAVEDLEIPDAQQLLATQLGVEDLEYFDAPILSETQIAVEDLEIYDLPVLRVTQVVVEILIPFDCDLTPPLELPPGCPPDEIEGTGSSSSGCADTPTTGSATNKAGCKPTFRN